MKRTLGVLVAGALICTSGWCAERVMTKDELDDLAPKPTATKTVAENDNTSLVTSDNLVFKVAKDRPFEKVTGSVGPVGLDSYIYLKFEKMEQILQRIESRIERLEAKVTADPAVKQAIEAQEQERLSKEEAERRAKQPKVLATPK